MAVGSRISSAYVLGLQLLLGLQLALVQAAELVDLVLVLAADLDLVPHILLILLCELRSRPVSMPCVSEMRQAGLLTMRRCILI